MNQHQRKFLLDQIEKMYNTEKEALNKKKPTEPSLNNYLVAAILDGTAVMRSTEAIRNDIRTRVRDLGKDESLVESGSGWGRRRDDDTDYINMPALILYEPPAAYAEKLKAYEEALAAWEEERKALESSINAMRIKIQVGSDKALSALVDQADCICRMSLTASSRLLIQNAK